MERQLKRIIIADDHAVVRSGLQLILDETHDMSIIDEARNGNELLEKLSTNEFDLVILDMGMPGKDSLDILKEIRVNWPKIPVVIFTMNQSQAFVVRMISNGASAFINKETQPAQIIEILRVVLSGKKYISAQDAEFLAEYISTSENPEKALHEKLTDREFQIFCLLASGKRNTDIAEQLDISINTLNNHRNSILKKMKLNGNSELTRYAIQAGIVQ